MCRSAFLFSVVVVVFFMFVPVISAVAPADAPPLVIPDPSGNTAPSTMAVGATFSNQETLSPHFSLWTLLGIALIAAAITGFLVLRRPKAYEPRAERLRK